jgi:hypothetical protein
MNTNDKNHHDARRHNDRPRTGARNPADEFDVIATRAGAARKHKPEVDGKLYLLGVQIRRRRNPRKVLIDYVCGWFVISREALENAAEGETPPHEFVPRFNCPDEDILESLRLQQEAAAEVKVYVSNLEKKADRVLTHRLSLDASRG